MDGGSTDETSSVVQDYAGRLTFISEKDRGQSHAINKGFRLARGRIVAWLNSDDVFLPGAIQTAVDAFARNSAAGAIYGEGYRIDRGGNITGRFPYTEPLNLWKLVHVSDYILQQTVFFRKDVLDQVGYLDESLHYTMDWDLLIRIGVRYPLVMVPEYLACIREYPEAKTSSGGSVRLREIRTMLGKHTRSRLPPGVIVYGADTYSNLCCERIEKAFGKACAPLSRSLQALTVRVAQSIARCAIVYSQGLSTDGWAARVLRYSIPSGNGRLLIAGHVPHRRLTPLSQRFWITANGRRLGKFYVPPGDFQMVVDLPAELQGQSLVLSIRSARWRMPICFSRSMAFLVKAIRWDPDVPNALSCSESTRLPSAEPFSSA
jgi:hypothetical protein